MLNSDTSNPEEMFTTKNSSMNRKELRCIGETSISKIDFLRSCLVSHKKSEKSGFLLCKRSVYH